MQQTLVIAVCLILAAVGLWQEWQRPAKTHLWLRVLALVVAVTALACLILPVSYTLNNRRNAGLEAVLLTEGFHKDSISAYPGLNIYTLDTIIRQRIPKAHLISDAGVLSEQQPVISLLHILGNGLNAYQLQQLKGLPVRFHLAVPADGITSVNYTTQINYGQLFKVQGQYHNVLSKPVKLQLLELNTVQDSITLTANKQTIFSLTARPKHTGKALYRVLVSNGTDTLSNEPLPATVHPAEPLKILLLSAAPDFENKFLKNWLSANGYGVAVRSAISKGKISTEFANMDKQALDRLTAAALSRFDVVTADAAALQVLTPTESGALYQQVSQHGLGLIVRADSSKAGWWQRDFSVNKPATQKPALVKLMITDAAAPSAALPLTTRYVSTTTDAQQVITDVQHHVLAANRLAGEGHIIFTTLTQTYPWALAGNQKDYASVWTALVNKAARRQQPASRWLISSFLPFTGEPVTLQLQTGLVVPVIQINQSATVQSQGAALPFLHEVIYWPKSSGWQQANTSGSTYGWYAYAENQWQWLKNQQKTEATLHYAATHPQNSPATKIIGQKIRIEVPKFYFYILLLLAFVYLWAESRWLS